MKIAITGHTAGIGKAFANWFEQQGHEVVGLSKREGNNIRSVPKIVPKIIECDLFINNAQAGYSQTELLSKVWAEWRGNPNKVIWNISTVMTTYQGVNEIPGLSITEVADYKNQKIALELMNNELKSISSKPHLTIIKPGSVATQPGQEAGDNYDDPGIWATTICEMWKKAADQNQLLSEIALSVKPNILKI